MRVGATGSRRRRRPHQSRRSRRSRATCRLRTAHAGDVGLAGRVVDRGATPIAAVVGAGISGGGDDRLALRRGLLKQRVLGRRGRRARGRLAFTPGGGNDLSGVVGDDLRIGVQHALIGIGALVDGDACARRRPMTSSMSSSASSWPALVAGATVDGHGRDRHRGAVTGLIVVDVGGVEGVQLEHRHRHPAAERARRVEPVEAVGGRKLVGGVAAEELA